MTTFENAQVSDKVWSFLYGWGIIRSIRDNPANFSYPMTIEFASGQVTYNFGGHGSSKYGRTLFWDELKFEVPTKPTPKLEYNHFESRSCDSCISKYCSIKGYLVANNAGDTSYFFCNAWLPAYDN